MELKQFITEVLTQIAEGTMGAAKVFTDNGGMINPKVAGYKGNAQTARVSNNKNAPDSILCDVRFSATLSENISETGRKGIGVQFE